MPATDLDTLLTDSFSPSLTPARAKGLVGALAEAAENYDAETRRSWALARLLSVIGDQERALQLLKALSPRRASLRVVLDGSPMGEAAVRVDVLLELIELAHAAGLTKIVSPQQHVTLIFYAGRPEAMAQLVRQYRSAGEAVFNRAVLEQLLVGRERELSERFALPYDGDRGPLEQGLIRRAAKAVLELHPDPEALQALASDELWSAPEAAIRHIDEAAALVTGLKDTPWGFAEAWLTQAKAHLRLGHRDEALASVRRAFDHVATMTADPDVGDFWAPRNLREHIWDDFGFNDFRKDPRFLALVRPSAVNQNVLALENLADPGCDACLKKGLVLLAKDKKASKALLKVMVGAVEMVILDLKEHGDSNLDDYALGSLEAYVAVKKALKKVSSPPTAAQLKSVQQLIARRPKSKAKTRAKPKAKPARKKR